VDPEKRFWIHYIGSPDGTIRAAIDHPFSYGIGAEIIDTRTKEPVLPNEQNYADQPIEIEKCLKNGTYVCKSPLFKVAIRAKMQKTEAAAK
jgi:hypothetical protein